MSGKGDRINPRISFGIIVLNGEPFTRYCIRALYRYAYQIIIAEGACYGAKDIARSDGHSADGTLEILKELKSHEDPENKLMIITAEDEGHPDGFWPGEKHQQSQAYATRATGEYLWQVDIDEFYREQDIEATVKILMNDPEINCISFIQKQFWGDFNHIVDGWYLRRGAEEFHRLFKWGPGYSYVSHRPPTVVNSDNIDIRNKKWIRGKEVKKRGIYLYHYAYVFKKQVDEKVKYYRNADWIKVKRLNWWKEEIYDKFRFPYRAFINTGLPGWIEKTDEEHPAQVGELISDIEKGLIRYKIRGVSDIELKVNSAFYRTGILFLKIIDPVHYYISLYSKTVKNKLKKII